MMAKSLRKLMIASSLVLASALAAGPAFAQADSGKKEDVLVRFTWKLKGEYAPLFVALEKGYYDKAGLNVTLAEGSGAQTVLKLLASGTENVAYGPAVAAAQAVSAGLPVKVVALYQVKAPMGVISFPDVPLSGPKDLEGKRIAISVGETFTDMLAPFAEINDVDLSKITRIQMDNSARTSQFMSRNVDVMSVYLSNELPKLEKLAGKKFNIMRVSDFGLSLLGASLIVGTEWAAENAETVRKLIEATNMGYRDAMANPEEAAEIMAKHMSVPEDADILLQQVKETVVSTNAPDGKPLGWQSEDDWKTNLDLLKRTGAITEVKDLGAYYTNEYQE